MEKVSTCEGVSQVGFPLVLLLNIVNDLMEVWTAGLVQVAIQLAEVLREFEQRQPRWYIPFRPQRAGT